MVKICTKKAASRLKIKTSKSLGRPSSALAVSVVSALTLALAAVFAPVHAASFDGYSQVVVNGGAAKRTNWNYELSTNQVCAQAANGITSVCTTQVQSINSQNVIVLSKWNSLDLRGFDGAFELSNSNYINWVNGTHSFELKVPIVTQWNYATQGYKSFTDDAEPMSVLAVKNLSNKAVGAPVFSIDPEIGELMQGNFSGRFYIVAVQMDFGLNTGLSRASQGAQMNWAGGNIVNIYEGANIYPLASLGLQTWTKWGYWKNGALELYNTYNFFTSASTINSALFVTHNLYIGNSTNFGTFNVTFSGNQESFYSAVKKHSYGSLQGTVPFVQLIEVTATSAFPRSVVGSDSASSSLTLQPIEMASTDAQAAFNFALTDGSEVVQIPLYGKDGSRYAAKTDLSFSPYVTVQSSTDTAKNGVFGTYSFGNDNIIYLEEPISGKTVSLLLSKDNLSTASFYHADDFTFGTALIGNGGFSYDGTGLGTMPLDGSVVEQKTNSLSGVVEVKAGHLVLRNQALGKNGSTYGYAKKLQVDQAAEVELIGTQTLGNLDLRYTGEADTGLELTAGSSLELTDKNTSSVIYSIYTSGASALTGSGAILLTGTDLEIYGRNAAYSGTVTLGAGSSVLITASNGLGIGTLNFSGSSSLSADSPTLTVNLSAREDPDLKDFALKVLLNGTSSGILDIQNLRGKVFSFRSDQTSFDGLMKLSGGAFALNNAILTKATLQLEDNALLTVSGKQKIANLTVSANNATGSARIENLSSENLLTITKNLTLESPLAVSMTVSGVESAALLSVNSLTMGANKDYGVFNVTYKGEADRILESLATLRSGSLEDTVSFVQLLSVSGASGTWASEGFTGTLNFRLADNSELGAVSLYKKDGTRFAARADALINKTLKVVNSGTVSSLNGLYGTLSYGNTLYLDKPENGSVVLSMDAALFAGAGLTSTSSFLFEKNLRGVGGFTYNGQGIGSMTLDGRVNAGVQNSLSGDVEVISGLVTFKNQALGSEEQTYGYARSLVLTKEGGADLIGSQSLGSITVSSANTRETGLYLTTGSELTITGRDFTDSTVRRASLIQSDYGNGIGSYSTLFGDGSLVVSGTTLTIKGRNANFSGAITLKGSALAWTDAVDSLGTGIVTFEKDDSDSTPTLTLDLSGRNLSTLSGSPKLSVKLKGTSCAVLNLVDLAGQTFTFNADQLSFKGQMLLSNGSYVFDNDILTKASLTLGASSYLSFVGSRSVNNLTVSSGASAVLLNFSAGSTLTVTESLTLNSPVSVSATLSASSVKPLISASALSFKSSGNTLGTFTVTYSGSAEDLYKEAGSHSHGTLDDTILFRRLIGAAAVSSTSSGTKSEVATLNFSFTDKSISALQMPLFNSSGERFAAHVEAKVLPTLTLFTANASDGSAASQNGLYAGLQLGGNAVTLENVSDDATSLVIGAELLGNTKTSNGVLLFPKALLGLGGFIFDGATLVNAYGSSHLVLDGAVASGVQNSLSGEVIVESGVLTLRDAALGSTGSIYGHAKTLRILEAGGAVLEGEQTVGRLELTSENSAESGLDLTEGSLLQLDGTDFQNPESVIISRVYSDYGTGAGTYSSLYGSGTLEVSNTTLKVTGRNAKYTGSVLIDGGTVIVDASDSLGTGTLEFKTKGSVLTIDTSLREASSLSDFVLSAVLRGTENATLTVKGLQSRSFAFNANQSEFDGQLNLSGGSFALSNSILEKASLTLGPDSTLSVSGQTSVGSLTIAGESTAPIIEFANLATDGLEVQGTLSLQSGLTIKLTTESLTSSNTGLIRRASTQQTYATLIRAKSLVGTQNDTDFTVIEPSGALLTAIKEQYKDSSGDTVATLFSGATGVINNNSIELATQLAEVQIIGGKTLALSPERDAGSQTVWNTFGAKISETKTDGAGANLTVCVDANDALRLTNSENRLSGDVVVKAQTAGSSAGSLVLLASNTLGDATSHVGTVYLVNGATLQLGDAATSGVSQEVSMVLSTESDLSQIADTPGIIRLMNNAHLTVRNFASKNLTQITSLVDADETSTLSLYGNEAFQDIYFTFHSKQFDETDAYQATFRGKLDLHGITVQSADDAAKDDTSVGAETSFILSEDSALSLNRLGYKVNELELNGGIIRVTASGITTGDLETPLLEAKSVVITGDVRFEIEMDAEAFTPSEASLQKLQSLNILRQQSANENRLLTLIKFDQENNALTEEDQFENYDPSKVSVYLIAPDSATTVNGASVCDSSVCRNIEDVSSIRMAADDQYGKNTRRYGVGVHSDDSGLHLELALLEVDVSGGALKLQSDLTENEVEVLSENALKEALTFTSKITGSGRLEIYPGKETVKASTIYLVNGENDYTGKTVVHTGATLVAATDNVLGATSEIALESGSVLRFLGAVSQSVPKISLEDTAEVVLGRVGAESPAYLTVTEAIQVPTEGTAQLEIVDASTLELKGESTFTRSASRGSGGAVRLSISEGATLAVEIPEYGIKEFDSALSLTGSGLLSITGSGERVLALLSANPGWQGAVSVAPGVTLELSDAAALGNTLSAAGSAHPSTVILEEATSADNGLESGTLKLFLENTSDAQPAVFSPILKGGGKLIAESSKVRLANTADWTGTLSIQGEDSEIWVKAENFNVGSVTGEGVLHISADESEAGTHLSALSSYSGEVVIESGHVYAAVAAQTETASVYSRMRMRRAAAAQRLPNYTIQDGAMLTLSGTIGTLTNYGTLNVTDAEHSVTVTNYVGGTQTNPSYLNFSVTEDFGDFSAGTLTISESAIGVSETKKVSFNEVSATKPTGLVLIKYASALTDYLSGAFRVNGVRSDGTVATIPYGGVQYYLLPQQQGYSTETLEASDTVEDTAKSSGYALYTGEKALRMLAQISGKNTAASFVQTGSSTNKEAGNDEEVAVTSLSGSTNSVDSQTASSEISPNSEAGKTAEEGQATTVSDTHSNSGTLAAETSATENSENTVEKVPSGTQTTAASQARAVTPTEKAGSTDEVKDHTTQSATEAARGEVKGNADTLDEKEAPKESETSSVADDTQVAQLKATDEVTAQFDWNSVGVSEILRTSLGAYVVSYLAPRSIEYRFTDHLDTQETIDWETGEKRRAFTWIRQYGSSARYSMGEGQLRIKEKIGSTILGLNLLEHNWGDYVVTTGGVTFASYYLQTKSTSTINSTYAPGMTKGTSVGKAVGLYASAYMPSRFGEPWLFAEAWTQYVRSSNKVRESGQDQVKYDGHGTISSVEVGGTLPLLRLPAAGHNYLVALQPQVQIYLVALQPQVQMVYEGVKYPSFFDGSGTLVAPDNDLNTKLRYGARFLFERKAEKSEDAIRAFVDISKIRNSGARGVTMFTEVYKEKGDQDYGEINVGVETQIGKRLVGRAAVGYRDGRQGYREAHGSVGVRFSF